MTTNEFTVTNGTIEYEHKKPQADYESKTPKVSLSFTIADGADPNVVTAKVMGIAVEVVERALATQITFKQADAVEVPAEPVKTRKPRAVNPTQPVAGEPAPSDPASVVDLDTASKDPSLISEPEPTPQEEDILDLGPAAKVIKEITDADIGAFCNRMSGPVHKEHGNLNKLREVVNKYAATAGHALTIPQNKRLEFMNDARTLVKADM